MSNPFEKLLGKTNELLILEELIALSDPDGNGFTVSEIQVVTELPPKKLQKVLNKFLKWNIITKTVKRDGPYLYYDRLEYYIDRTYYTLNLESPYVKAIIAFNNALIEDCIGEEELYDIRDYLNEHIKDD